MPRANETNTEYQQRLADERAEKVRRDTTPPYDWDEMETNRVYYDLNPDANSFVKFTHKSYQWKFNEEYITNGPSTVVGYWKTNHEFIAQDSQTTFFITPKSIQVSGIVDGKRRMIRSYYNE